jgi:uncharacterized membrane protein
MVESYSNDVTFTILEVLWDKVEEPGSKCSFDTGNLNLRW